MQQPSLAAIRRLHLTNFRSYPRATLSVDRRMVVLTGPNGAGKTNILEALSFLSPGRGLRRATLDEVAFAEGDGSWAVAAQVDGAFGLATLGTGIERRTAEAGGMSRRCLVDGEPVGSAAAFGDHLSMVWLTPAQDSLFVGPASDRRRFADRLTLALDANHNSRVSGLERALRSRNRLLEDPNPDRHWLDAVEHETAELATAVAAARTDAVRRLAAACALRSEEGAFPQASIALDGWMEQALLTGTAAEVEDRYRAVLRDNRPRDAAAGRTLDGPHLTDLRVAHAGKGIPAERCSTGEQKALLIGLILAQADLIREMTRCAPVLLLDEVAAHLDPQRRGALYDELARRDLQVWMTGADPATFAGIEERADVFEVRPGEAHRR